MSDASEASDPAALFTARITVLQYLVEFTLANLLRHQQDPFEAAAYARNRALEQFRFQMRIEEDAMPGVDPLAIQSAGVKLVGETFDRIVAILLAKPPHEV